MACKAMEERGLDRFAIRAFGALSDYGHSITRPADWLLVLFVVFAVIFRFILKLAANAGEQSYNVFLPIGLSISNIFAFLGFHRLFLGDFLQDASAWLIFWSGLQTVSAFPVLFLLGLGLRNRFRLK